MSALTPDRRRFVQGLALAGGVSSFGLARGQASAAPIGQPGAQPLFGPVFDLTVEETPANVTGRARMATTVNGSRPGPTLYWREGDELTINLTRGNAGIRCMQVPCVRLGRCVQCVVERVFVFV